MVGYALYSIEKKKKKLEKLPSNVNKIPILTISISIDQTKFCSRPFGPF